MTTTVRVATDDRVQVLDVTDEVADAVAVEDGLCAVTVRHTTAGITVNEAEEGLMRDIEDALRELVPRDGGYRHDAIDDNADGHIRAALLGSSAALPVEDGEPALGTWQRVLLVECDGPRRREIAVTAVPGAGR